MPSQVSSLALQILEIVSFSCNLLFLILLIAEKKQCWIYGIIGSLTGALLFYHNHLYSETILYVFYAIVGVYGYIQWSKPDKALQITNGKPVSIFLLVIIGLCSTFGLGKVMSLTDAERPFLDAFSSSFGIIATFLELNKILVAWVFWIVLNAFSIWFYGSKDLNFMTIQMVIYLFMSFYGLYQWNKKLT